MCLVRLSRLYYSARYTRLPAKILPLNALYRCLTLLAASLFHVKYFPGYICWSMRKIEVLSAQNRKKRKAKLIFSHLVGRLFFMDAQTFEETELAYLKQSFIQHGRFSFGRADGPNASSFYSWLALQAAEDREILWLLLHANTRPQRPHILFAAVQYLLFSGVQDELAEFYPGMTINPRPREEAYPYFRAFCLRHTGEIERLVTTYGVQNNEVGRCADLLFAFDRMARQGDGKPLAMLELGPSRSQESRVVKLC